MVVPDLSELFGLFEGGKNLGGNAFHAFNVGMAGFLFDVIKLEERNAIVRANLLRGFGDVFPQLGVHDK